MRYAYGCEKMIEVPLPDAAWLISPRVTVLINTLDERGELNSSPYSFVFPLGSDPPMVGVSVGNKQKATYINSKKNAQFVVCVVSEDFGQRAVNCEAPHKPGDKLWQEQGFHAERSKKVNVPRIKEARAILECKVSQFVELNGGRVILVGEVLHAETEERGLDNIRPLLHVSGGRFRSIGREIVLERRR
jgi:flavin reductase (DIM6/NTAB) family NADH-FMN oxidoreductase RutF